MTVPEKKEASSNKIRVTTVAMGGKKITHTLIHASKEGF